MSNKLKACKEMIIKVFLLLLFVFSKCSLLTLSSKSLSKDLKKMISLQALTNLSKLSNLTSAPNWAYMLMKQMIKCRVKVQRKTSARNFLEKCEIKGVGTNSIEALAKKTLYGDNDSDDKPRNKQVVKEVRRILKIRVMMANVKMRSLKREWVMKRKQLVDALRCMRFCDQLTLWDVLFYYDREEQAEMQLVWHEQARVLGNRITWLMKKHKVDYRLRHDEKLRNVKVRNSAGADGVPRSRVCARLPLRSAPIDTSGNFQCTCLGFFSS